MNNRLYLSLILISLIATVGAILTLVPAGGASWENVLGYRSLCTFAPAATLYCAFVAGTTCLFRASLVKRRAMYGKPTVRRIPVIVMSVILALAVASTVWFVRVDSQYPDGTTSATAEA